MEHRFTFRLNEELFAKLVQYCKENKRSVNQGLQFLLEHEMDKYFAYQDVVKQYNEGKLS